MAQVDQMAQRYVGPKISCQPQNGCAQSAVATGPLSCWLGQLPDTRQDRILTCYSLVDDAFVHTPKFWTARGAGILDVLIPRCLQFAIIARVIAINESRTKSRRVVLHTPPPWLFGTSGETHKWCDRPGNHWCNCVVVCIVVTV